MILIRCEECVRGKRKKKKKKFKEFDKNFVKETEKLNKNSLMMDEDVIRDL